MTKAIFVFIVSILLIYPLVSGIGQVTLSDQLLLCLPFILFLGIPHGAIDNVLYIKDKSLNNKQFIGLYLISIGLYIGLWFVLPILAYIIFLVLSAYHFGQSQFSHYFQKQPLINKILYALWGAAILSGFMFFKSEEIAILMESSVEFSYFQAVHQEYLLQVIFYASTFMTLVLMLILRLRSRISWEVMFMEILVFMLILVCFYLMPLLIGFTLYFVILHSFKVLKEEYDFLNEEMGVKSILGFVKIIAPFTLLAVFGIFLMYGLIYLDMVSLSYGYCLLIIISAITLPHVFVMNNFYELFFHKKSYHQLK